MGGALQNVLVFQKKCGAATHLHLSKSNNLHQRERWPMAVACGSHQNIGIDDEFGRVFHIADDVIILFPWAAVKQCGLSIGAARAGPTAQRAPMRVDWLGCRHVAPVSRLFCGKRGLRPYAQRGRLYAVR